MSPQRERELRKAQMAAAAARRAEPDAGPAGRTAIRSKPIRITLDLSPELYRELTGWADSAAIELGVPRISLAAAVRAMIRVTADQPDPVLDRLRHDRDKLARSAGHGGATPLAPPAELATGARPPWHPPQSWPSVRRARRTGPVTGPATDGPAPAGRTGSPACSGPRAGACAASPARRCRAASAG
jgi:hypothetical protein